jgi:ribosomal protein L29
MAILKAKDAAKMSTKEIEEKVSALRVELIKAQVATKKVGKSNPKEIKKTIARLLTFKKLNEGKNKQNMGDKR